jgi:hypothetical protein
MISYYQKAPWFSFPLHLVAMVVPDLVKFLSSLNDSQLYIKAMLTSFSQLALQSRGSHYGCYNG